MKKSIIIEISACVLILLFFYASFSKYFDISEYKTAMLRQPLSSWLAITLFWLIPPIEIGTAILLMLPKTRKIGFMLSFVMMAAFSIYIGLALLHTFGRIPCSCGGVIKDFTWTQHLVFNLFFTTVSIIGLFLTGNFFTPRKRIAI